MVQRYRVNSRGPAGSRRAHDVHDSMQTRPLAVSWGKLDILSLTAFHPKRSVGSIHSTCLSALVSQRADRLAFWRKHPSQRICELTRLARANISGRIVTDAFRQKCRPHPMMCISLNSIGQLVPG